MELSSRTVIAYHGCVGEDSRAFGQRLLRGEIPVAEWLPSQKEYDWLGEGIYFWEDSVDRAIEWSARGGEEPFVVGAIIDLGRCFDLTQPENHRLLRETHKSIAEAHRRQGRPLPTNAGAGGMMHHLDCFVINQAMVDADAWLTVSATEDRYFQTVRCPFEEGQPVFPGSMIRTQTHIQIAVRDLRAIRGVFRPSVS